MSAETHEFQAEVKQLLDLMIHSLYSNRDVFLRELVSNASDALDRLRFAGLTDSSLLPDEPLEVRLRSDAEARTLSVEDNGIGMTREDVSRDLGTIARSGTLHFLRELEERGAQDAPPELIGQFGVGFYASFMVADRVSVLTRRAGEDKATCWESAGDGRYTISDGERATPGTTVTLQLKPADPEGGLADFADEFVLRSIVKRYSDFVAYPIRLWKGDEAAGDGEPLNSMKAIWTRPAEEVSEEEYAEFYKHISHDWNDPLLRVPAKIEGLFDARALLYVPKVAPFDLYHRERAHRGIQLYVKRVFIMDDCRELMPEYLRFVRGVVESEELSLNVSREVLQQDRQIQTIRKHLVKKVVEALSDLRKRDASEYEAFWRQFGPVLKEALLLPGEPHERIFDLTLCHSTRDDAALTGLDEAVDRMPEDREVIYYLNGPSLDVLRASPHLEAFRDKGIEVLLFTDHVDEVWLQQLPPSYRDKRWQSAARGELALPSEGEGKGDEDAEQRDEAGFGTLLARLRAAIQDDVREVRLSKRLTRSPACLVLEEGDLSPELARMLSQAGQEVPQTKPILELNPSHPLLPRLREICEADEKDPRIGEYAELLFAQALLAEGRQLPDPAAFTTRLADLMLRGL